MRAKAKEMQANGELGSNLTKRLDSSDLKQRDENIAALKHFQGKMGIDESKYIKQFEECRTGKEIRELEMKMRSAATHWYRNRLVESRAYEPIEGEDMGTLNRQISSCVEWFQSDQRSLMDMAVTHERFKQDIEHQREFRAELRRQTPFIKKEYLRRVKEIEAEERNRPPFSQAPKKDRAQLLNEVKNEIKEVQEAPSAVQEAFSKLQKKGGDSKSTLELANDVKAEYKKKCDEYRSRILENHAYFGGEIMNTKYGKMSESAWEFIEWFEELETFTAMDNASKKLSALIKERQQLFKKRDAILKHANPEEREKLYQKTQKMRRHELKAFLPEMEIHVRKNSVHVLEYIGLLHTARQGNVSVFSTEEIIKMSIQFQFKDLASQKAYLIVLEDKIIERRQVISDYFKLPIHARHDQEFLKANAYEREKMLSDAIAQLNREKENPLDMSGLSGKNSKEIASEIVNRINSGAGKNTVKETINKMDTKVLENQLAMRNKMFGVAKDMEENDLTFKGAYLSDLATWMRTSRNLWEDEKNVGSERDQWKYDTLQTAREMYDYGIVFTSGGQIKDLKKVSMDEFSTGQGANELMEAQYSQHTILMGDDGKDVLDPMEATKQEFLQGAMQLIEMLLLKLSYGKMNLSSSVIQMIRNSEDIQRTLAQQLIGEEFGDLLDPQAANNTDHFINEALQAA